MQSCCMWKFARPCGEVLTPLYVLEEFIFGLLDILIARGCNVDVTCCQTLMNLWIKTHIPRWRFASTVQFCVSIFFSSNNASGSRTSLKTNYKPLPPLIPHCKALWDWYELGVICEALHRCAQYCVSVQPNSLFNFKTTFATQAILQWVSNSYKRALEDSLFHLSTVTNVGTHPAAPGICVIKSLIRVNIRDQCRALPVSWKGNTYPCSDSNTVVHHTAEAHGVSISNCEFYTPSTGKM